MSDCKIFLDAQALNPGLPPQTSAALLVSIIDRALLAENMRIFAATSESGEDVFSPAGLGRTLDSFLELRLESGPIPTTPRCAVASLCIGEKYADMLAVAEPFLKGYAQKIAADYILIDQPKLGIQPVHFEKWQLYELLFKYDRIIYLDSDLLVAPGCPDLFQLVPRDKIGAFDESPYYDRSPQIAEFQEKLGELGWRGTYLNSGVGIYSHIHRPLFERPERFLVYDYEQGMYNYRVQQLGFKICFLSMEFNRMELNGPDRMGSHIIHYAGRGYAGKGTLHDYHIKLNIMRDDAATLASSAPKAFLPPLMPYLNRIGPEPHDSICRYSTEYYEGRESFFGDLLLPAPAEEASPRSARIKASTNFSDWTFLPFLVRNTPCEHFPIGDALLALPIVRESGMKLYLPPGFAGDLVAHLAPDVERVRELGSDTLANQIFGVLLGNHAASLSVRHWGSAEFCSRYGKLNSTQALATALGLALRDPAPRVRRPGDAVKKRVIIFSKGSLPLRCLEPEWVVSTMETLRNRGYEVLSGDLRFESPAEFADFVSSAEYVIAPSTGPMHMAAAMGVKTIALNTGNSEWAYRPLQKNALTLSGGCERCWTEHVKQRACGERLPLCQRNHTPERLLSAMSELDAMNFPLSAHDQLND